MSATLLRGLPMNDNDSQYDESYIQHTIREMREKENWTQEYMAEQLGMSENGYAKIERGETSLSLKRLKQIADIFGIDTVDLLKKRNVVCLVNENSTHSNNYYGNSDEKLQHEIEKLKLMLSYKDKLLIQKDEQIDSLKNLVSVLQNK